MPVMVLQGQEDYELNSLPRSHGGLESSGQYRPSVQPRIRRKPLPVSTYTIQEIDDDGNPIDADTALLTSELDQQSNARHSEAIDLVGNAHALTQGVEAVPYSAENVRDDRLSGEEKIWLPNSLNAVYLIILSAVAFVLAAICVILLVYSGSNRGLGLDNGRTSLAFGWRFAPTLIAVLYVLGTSIVLDDVKRTESFARLARPYFSNAQSTLCRVPGPWWNAVRDAFGEKQNGKRINWALLSAALVYIFGFLAISPLSSSLLDSLTVNVSASSSFVQLDPWLNGSLKFVADQDVTLRTVAHQLQNLSTSAWINDDYFILPFGPLDAGAIRLGPVLADAPSKWQTSTLVVKTSMDCQQLGFVNISTYVYRELGRANITFNTTYYTLSLNDSNDCNITVFNRTGNYNYKQGVGSWFVAPDYLSTVWEGKSPFIDMTDSCRGREIILAIDSWPPPRQANITVKPASTPFIAGYRCKTSYYMANTSVTVTTTSRRESFVTVDEVSFAKNRREMPQAVFDATLFQRMFVASNWSSFQYPSSFILPTPKAGGPLSLLLGTYDKNITYMAMDSNLTLNANRFKQRFLGESLMAALTNKSLIQGENLSGSLVADQQRIVVNTAVATTLAVLLFLSAILILITLRMTRLSRRPLHLSCDPCSLVSFMPLLLHDSSTRKLFSGTEQASTEQMVSLLSDSRHQLTRNGLHSIGMVHYSGPSQQADDWRPLAIKRRNGLGLFLFLLILTSGVAAFWAVAERSGLYNKVFSYQASVSFESTKFTFAPYSLVPTLLAVSLGLWWGDVESTFRRIQPYVEMAKGPIPMSQGPGLTYITSYLLWGAVRAAENKHWILSLLYIGATLTEIFTVSMSAIFERRPGSIQQQTTLTPQFELRIVPFITQFMTNPSGAQFNIPAVTLAALYSTLNTNWMYSAVLQLAFNASEPQWSKDGWSFTPVGLNSVQNSTLVGQVGSKTSLTDQRILQDTASINVTTKTSALHARLDCSLYETNTNSSALFTEWDLTNSTVWNVSVNPTSWSRGYELGYIEKQNGNSYWHNEMQVNFGGKSVQIPFFNNICPLQCCSNNVTDTLGPACMGYWSYQSTATGNRGEIYYLDRSSTQGTNITTKWIYGTPQFYRTTSSSKILSYYPNEHLIWKDKPQLTALNCQPIIEFAEASVTVERSSGMVQDFQLLSQPKTIERDAWNASYRLVNYLTNDPIDRPAHWATSYGVLFEDALMYASDLYNLDGFPKGYIPYSEPIIDRTFNFRAPGLNMDFMTFAMFSLAGKNLTALLDPVLQAQLATRVFSTFFQHFVSSNVTSNGSWTYVPINSDSNKLNYYLKGYTSSVYPTYDSIPATVSQRVEVLQMNLTAVAICLGILSFLIITVIVIYVFDYKHFDRLRHDTNSMADVIRLVSDSPKLLTWVAQNQGSESTIDQQAYIRTESTSHNRWKGLLSWERYSPLSRNANRTSEPRIRLGTFTGTDGKKKWIVEIEE